MIRLTDGQAAMVRRAMALEGEPARTRVVVAMSGGVDSTVAAALLKGAGYDVVGITLQLYDAGDAPGGSRKGACCAGQDVHDARRAAASFGIPHYVLDFESRFRDTVIADFADSYLRGETPVPCITCNRTVKFADLLGRAEALSAAALVTGHYAVASRNRSRPRLLTPTDMQRDQTYFLYATTRRQLAALRFPLGGMTKEEIRGLARSFGLGVADKPDSQDICFVPDGRYRDLLLKLRPEMAAPGEIVDLAGRVIGRHDGVANFTVGQRRGLNLAGPEPRFVVSLDARRRRVVVGPRSALRRRRILLEEVNWLGPDHLPLSPAGFTAHVKVRSTRPPTEARIVRLNGAWRVEIPEGEEAVSPGQACVFYERPGPGAEVFGGGRIVGSQPDARIEEDLPEPELERVPAQ